MEAVKRDVVAALVRRDDGRFMVCRRPEYKARGGLFEFPGGKVEEGETRSQALIRECREELAVTVRPLGVYMELDHVYPDISIHLVLMDCVIAEGEPRLLEHSELRWILPEEVDGLEFCPADADILKKIKEDAGI
ncbi:MAG: (deoxy)nucleoside triphosphate pyrophosphohydrolase [Firmicutes bacterium]|nr:(deoxy)nucleoside triphosphate pyrophosphohydrolase [Bacillota bacterium]MBQ3577181.1 (deoxy)nucleoside triphosphate pyrophosphohydrolase [Bacillota bacterium]MBQ4235006.1 (deoxy)nucleoside triphosphate pyrophosphohydrolase [Bacillota bacterium]MBQ6013544.1 (deoxy)nucleoside triphosphate pyrophosphohydrolase [Bacillota bacterium]MBQ6261368.1 (deoxy)nucleoside triphosphate pyrophosphohydrolase [Bacillota bacterium]